MNNYPNRTNITKSQLRKCGKILAKNPHDIEALSKVNQWRASHAYPMHIIFNSSKKKAKRISNNFIAAQRIKRLPTIVNKLKRHKHMCLDTMQDIGGVRIIFKDIKHLNEFIGNTSLGDHKLIKVYNYIEKPKLDGYRGVHLVYEYLNKKKSFQYNGLKIELQVRTQLQHEWATAVEAIGISTHKHIKLGSGDEKWKKFFELTSKVLSFAETPKIARSIFKNSLEKTFNELLNIEKELNGLAYLKGLVGSIDFINKDKKIKGKYFVLSVNATERVVRIFGFVDYVQANDFYEKRESESDADSWDNVLISVNDIAKISKAYPNYFLDVSNFCERIETILGIKNQLDK